MYFYEPNLSQYYVSNKKKSLKIIMNKTFIHMDIVSLLLTKI